MNIKLNVQEIFDINSEFELQMFQVFSARNDLNIVNVMLGKTEIQRETVFLFKIMIGILRESIMLINELTQKHKKEIDDFNNVSEIQKGLDKFYELNSGMENDSFSCQVLSKIRHQIFHYNETKNIKEMLLNLSDPIVTFQWENTIGEIEYTFTNELTYKYIIKKYGEFDEKEDVNEFIKIITPYSLCVKNVLEKLTLGYLDRYTNLFDGGFDGVVIKRK